MSSAIIINWTKIKFINKATEPVFICVSLHDFDSNDRAAYLSFTNTIPKAVNEPLHHDKHSQEVGFVTTANIDFNATTRDLHCEKDTQIVHTCANTDRQTCTFFILPHAK